ncbi:MAG: valine--tRNA ligase [Verrucomicrobiota bacterium]
MPELAKAYEPGLVEEKHYSNWLESGHYHADPESGKPPFSIVIPPPNVTGILTLGHVLNNTIQDILCRRARMKGFEVLWLPGTDHAGLATQTKVEKAVADEGTSKEELGREAFLEKVVEWKDKHGGIIIQQLKKLGCSCDWERERFTMDDEYYQSVIHAFISLYEKGYIYRGKRMVNWCPASMTAISDEEVIMTPQTGKLYTMKYEIVERPGAFLEIATTRPETLMGDTAVAVHPEDERYKEFVGLHCRRPFPEAKIPIIADDHLDPEFGTGVLKVTPAHDKADFEIGERHSLPLIDVITKDGTIDCPDVPELHGMERFKAREKAADLLEEMGLLIKKEKYKNNVGFSERGNVPIEPKISEQWFFKYPRVDEALRVVNEKQITFWPERWEKVYNHWLENIQDWCISRQIWWGHRIPIWYKGEEMKCQSESPGEGWEQDPDALDTWFSSWLWAYETMTSEVRNKFYPTSVLVTGPDIIFLWVARMIFAGLEFRPGQDETTQSNIPFKDVYFTGLIRDQRGRKLSKSLGNSPDPLELIAQHGADGLRFGMMRVAPQGLDIRYDEKQVEEGRNFCNKLWNACRFRQMQGTIDPQAQPQDHELSAYAHLALQELASTIDEIDTHYERYEFNQVAACLYSFVWGDFCSRFLEAAKADFGDPDSPTRSGTLATIDYILSQVLRLLHPYAPFMTEELWLELGFDSQTIQFASWPKADLTIFDPDEAKRAEDLYALVNAGRSLKGEFQIAGNQRVSFQLHTQSELKEKEREDLTRLLQAQSLNVVEHPPLKTPMIISPLGDLYLPLEGLVDVDKEKERLSKAINKVEQEIVREQKKLSNEQMLANAPEEKVTEWKQLYAEAKDKLAKLKTQFEQLSG